MLIFLTSLLLMASVPGSSLPAGQPSSDDCEDTRRLELSPPVLASPRICISPGTLTGVIFNHPVTMELQEEVRFIEVTRGRMGLAFIPPRDLRPGETLRLTAALGAGETSQNLTFVLVTHPGHGSHQVEVSYRPRNWQSLTDSLSQVLLANQRLRAENAALAEEGIRLREQLAQPTGLCGAFESGQLSNEWGIAFRRAVLSPPSTAPLAASRMSSYRGRSTVGVEVAFSLPVDPWILEEATLVNERGEQREALRYRQTIAPAPDEALTVFVEFDPKDFTLGQSTLRLTGTGGRVVTLTHVVFP